MTNTVRQSVPQSERLEKIPPNPEFSKIFISLSDVRKVAIKTALYGTVRGYLLREKAIIDGIQGRYQKILDGETNIDIQFPIADQTQPITLTDEQTLLGVNSSSIVFQKKIPGIHSGHIQDYAALLQIYIDSSVDEKIAILKYLEGYLPGVPDSIVLSEYKYS